MMAGTAVTTCDDIEDELEPSRDWECLGDKQYSPSRRCLEDEAALDLLVEAIPVTEESFTSSGLLYPKRKFYLYTLSKITDGEIIGQIIDSL